MEVQFCTDNNAQCTKPFISNVCILPKFASILFSHKNIFKRLWNQLVLNAIPLYENLLHALKYLDHNVNKLSVILDTTLYVARNLVTYVFAIQIGNIYDRKQINALF